MEVQLQIIRHQKTEYRGVIHEVDTGFERGGSNFIIYKTLQYVGHKLKKKETDVRESPVSVSLKSDT